MKKLKEENSTVTEVIKKRDSLQERWDNMHNLLGVVLPNQEQDLGALKGTMRVFWDKKFRGRVLEFLEPKDIFALKGVSRFFRWTLSLDSRMNLSHLTSKMEGLKEEIGKLQSVQSKKFILNRSLTAQSLRSSS